jgi:hypothetical protein
MKRLAILGIIGLLAACSGYDTQTDTRAVAGSEDRLANGTVCRIGPNGGPVTALARGPSHAAAVVADRGIGGTGKPQLADRGIGGTGIVGVITGFASICVNGLEVRFDNAAAVDIDGVPASAAALRAGQVVAVLASGPAAEPVARSISVRREVVGRIEAIGLESGMLTVAGQGVAVTPGTWGAGNVHLGDWVSVSGLRGASGTLVATRLDAAPSGTFAAHGKVVADATGVHIGGLALAGTAAQTLKTGQYVTVSGHSASGQNTIAAVKLDPLAADPGDYFGAGVSHMVLEGFVRVASGAVWLDGRKISAAAGVAAGSRNGLAVVSLDRKPDGTFTAVGLRYTRDHAFPRPSIVRAEPAPSVRRTSLPAAADDPAPPPSAAPATELSAPVLAPFESAPPESIPLESLPSVSIPVAAAPVGDAVMAMNRLR